MAEIKVRAVGGSTWTDLPEPDYNGGLTWSIQDISSATSGRDNSTGTMHIDRVATKRKLTCKWTNRDSEAIKIILDSAIKNTFFECQYFDIQDGATRISTMYVGDRTAPIYSTVLGANHNKRIIGSFTANFVER